MEETQTTPPAEAPASAERPSAPESAAPPQLASLSDAARAEADVSGGDDRSADADRPDQKPAPSGGRETRGRRSQAAEANAQRIAELERQLADRDPEKIRAQILADRAADAQRSAEQSAEQQRADSEQADAERYARLRDLPDRELSDDDYRWREDRKALLAAWPKARTALEAQSRQQAEAARAYYEQQLHGAWGAIHGQMSAAFSKPGVDRARMAKETSFSEIADHLYDAGRASLQPTLDQALEENRRLRAEAQALRVSGRNGLAGTRAPVSGGRSAAHATGTPDFRTATASELFAAAARQSASD